MFVCYDALFDKNTNYGLFWCIILMHYLIRTQIIVCFVALFDKNTQVMVSFHALLDKNNNCLFVLIHCSIEHKLLFVLVHYLIRTQIMVCFDALFDKKTNYGLLCCIIW